MNTIFVFATAGTMVGLIAAAALFLQARRLMMLGTACEVSIPVRVLTLVGYGIWLGYGVVLGDIPLILVDLAGVVGAALVLHVTVSLRRRQPCAVPTAEHGSLRRGAQPALVAADSSSG